MGYVYRLSKKSEQMLKATLALDTDTMFTILEYAHNTEAHLLDYSNEAELTALVNLVYLSARDNYRVEREDKAGTGYVDFIFYPETDRNADGIILELKVNHTADEAIRQIKDKKYALKFEGKLGEKRKYTGRIVPKSSAFLLSCLCQNPKLSISLMLFFQELTLCSSVMRNPLGNVFGLMLPRVG